MKIIRQDDYKIIPRSGSVLPYFPTIGRPKNLILPNETYANPTFNHTCHNIRFTELTLTHETVEKP